MDIQYIVEHLQQGGIVAVTDDEQRENEADLILAATHITQEQMAFCIRNTSGIICVAMQEERLRALGLERLPTDNPAHFDTPFTMSVDVKEGTRGGVSAEERTATVHALVDDSIDPSAFGRPGHVFPLVAHAGGLAARQGHTEAGVALMQLAGMYPAAVIAELMNEDGTMMRGNTLREFTTQHDIPLISIDDIRVAMSS